MFLNKFPDFIVLRKFPFALHNWQPKLLTRLCVFLTNFLSHFQILQMAYSNDPEEIDECNTPAPAWLLSIGAVNWTNALEHFISKIIDWTDKEDEEEDEEEESDLDEGCEEETGFEDVAVEDITEKEKEEERDEEREDMYDDDDEDSNDDYEAMDWSD